MKASLVKFSFKQFFWYKTSDADFSGKLKGLFSGGASSSDEATTESAENTPPRDSEPSSASAASSSASASTTPAAEKKEAKKAAAPVENTISLSLEVTFSTIPPMTVAQKKTSRSRFVNARNHSNLIAFMMLFIFPRLRAIDAEELTKTRREEARNTFESYLYRLRDLLDEDNKETPFKKCSQAGERNAIAEKLDESFAWLSDRGDLAETSQFLDKRIALEYVFHFGMGLNLIL